MPLHIQPADPSDIPALIDLYFATFNSPLVLRLKPNVPSSREWYRAKLETSFEKSYCYTYIVVDDSEAQLVRQVDSQQQPLRNIIAFATWTAPHPAEEPSDPQSGEDKWPVDGDPAMFDTVAAEAAQVKKDILGDREHWYLSVLATLPQHQRRGAGSMLMAELCRQADEAGECAYVEASPLGKSTYERFGFITKGSFTTMLDGEGYVDSCMLREPQNGKS